MSEGNKNPEKNLSRRSFLKLGTAVIGGAALGGAVLTGKKVLEDLGFRFETQGPVTDNFFYQESQQLAESTQAIATPTPFQSVEATPEPTPTPEILTPWEFVKGIDFSDSKRQIDMAFFVGADTILIPAFTPFAYYNGALEDGAFEPDSNTGLTYLDKLNRKILNLHSGRRGPLDAVGFTAWGLQRYIEEYPENGVRKSPGEVDNFMESSFLNSDVVIKQKDTSSLVKVVGIVRVPPRGVEESQKHVGDIVDWLGSAFPDSGFRNLGNSTDTLIIKFCGRILQGEAKVHSRPDYQQSRFFIALKQK